MSAADTAFDGGAGKIGGLGAQPGQRVEQRGLAGIGIADQREGEGVMRQLSRSCSRLARTARTRNFTASLMPCASRIAQWSGVQTSSQTREASEADKPSREPKTRTTSGSPVRTTSSRRPTQMPSVLSRCTSSPSVSMRRTTAHCRGGSASSRVSRSELTRSLSWLNKLKAAGKSSLSVACDLLAAACAGGSYRMLTRQANRPGCQTGPSSRPFCLVARNAILQK